MAQVPIAGGGPTPLAVFDRFRTQLLAKVQEPELKRYAVMLLAFGAGLLPLMAGSAKAGRLRGARARPWRGALPA